MIQRIYAVVEIGNEEDSLMYMIPMTRDGKITEDIAPSKHYRDERAIAAALRRLATQIEKGCMFGLTDTY